MKAIDKMEDSRPAKRINTERSKAALMKFIHFFSSSSNECYLEIVHEATNSIQTRPCFPGVYSYACQTKLVML